MVPPTLNLRTCADSWFVRRFGLPPSLSQVSSFWTLTLSWQTFFCCMVSTTVTDWLLSSFGGFRNKVASPFDFGLFKDDSSLLFRVEVRFDCMADCMHG